MIVEVGFLLDKDISYYNNLLNKKGIYNTFNCETHDIYYTNISLDNLTENEMKRACVRLRMVNSNKCKIQNYDVFDELKEMIIGLIIIKETKK